MRRRGTTGSRPARGSPATAGGHRAGWARLALPALLASVLVPLTVADLRSVLWVLVGVA